MPDRAATTVNEAGFRTVCGYFTTGVTVVTAAGPDGPLGMAVNSFASVSLDPPLVLFCASRTSGTLPGIETSGSFAVNVLASGQEALARGFAGKGGDRFAGVAYRSGVTGSPVLTGALAYLECRIEAEHDGGDHLIVVGRVVDLDVLDEGGDPLVFYRGGYRDLD